MDWPHDDEAKPVVPQPASPMTFRPGPGLLIFFGGLEAFLVGLTFLTSSPFATTSAGALVVTVALMPLGALWIWLGRYSVTVNEGDLWVSTNLWRVRGRQPIRFSRTNGVHAVVHDSQVDRSVTINGLHLETPTVTIFQSNSLADGLRLASVTVEEQPATVANFLYFALYLPLLFAWMFALYTPGMGLPALVVAAFVIAGLCTFHSLRVDRQWRRIAAQVSAVSAAPTESAS